MKHLVFATLFLGTFCLSPIAGDETVLRIREAEKGFQERWRDFDAREFALWNPNWTEKELKERFDQMAAERCQIYFINPKDCSKPNLIGEHRELYAVPQTDSWGSRYSTSGSFSYNLAGQYNASIISLHGKRFLAMEGPIQENFQTFCQLLDEYHVTNLVRLTPAFYKDRENSFPYWEGHIHINPHNGRNTVYLNGKELNYFFTDSWNNHDGIDPQRLIALVKAVMEDESETIAVHCRAGIGRTGTFIAAYTLIHDIDAQIASGIGIDRIQVSVDKIFWELSLQRPFMISHFPQYATLYQLVNTYVDSLNRDSAMAFPNYPEKWNLPSLITPQKTLSYYQSLDLAPSCPPPRTIIFCYSQNHLKRISDTYRMRECDGKLPQVQYFEDYPGVAVAYFGVGAPSNAKWLDFLYSWGVKNCISIGIAGSLQKDLKPGDIIVCDRAVRDEGTSRHYLPASKYADSSKGFTEDLCQTLDEMKIPYQKGSSWTTDGFYRQTKEEIAQYQHEGILTVEMEASALFSVASVHHAQIVSLFTISDTLGDLEWKPSFQDARRKKGEDILVEAALKLASKEPSESIEIAPYDPEWPQMFETEAAPIQGALGDNCLAIHHFGSTSVPNLSAKPKIDILAVVRHLSAIDSSAIEKLGFEARGEVIQTGRYFSKQSPHVHLHIFEIGNPLIERNLIFRDWLRTHDDDRNAYEALKKDLASVYHDGMSYSRAKTEFINQIVEKAQALWTVKD